VHELGEPLLDAARNSSSPYELTIRTRMTECCR
jgi:hypothetical protein